MMKKIMTFQVIGAGILLLFFTVLAPEAKADTFCGGGQTIWSGGVWYDPCYYVYETNLNQSEYDLDETVLVDVNVYAMRCTNNIDGPQQVTVSAEMVHTGENKTALNTPTPETDIHGGFAYEENRSYGSAEFNGIQAVGNYVLKMTGQGTFGQMMNTEDGYEYVERGSRTVYHDLLFSVTDTLPGQPPSSNPAPTLNFSATPQSIMAGETTNLRWSTTNATACTVSVNTPGSSGSPEPESQTEIPTCSGQVGGSQASAVLLANAPCEDSGVSSDSSNDLVPISPSETTTYTISCSGPGGSVANSVIVYVTTPPALETSASTTTPTPTTTTSNNNNEAPAGYTQCASEGERCVFSGTASVVYGANGNYNYLNLTDGTPCTNQVFGDPIEGTAKVCYYKAINTQPSTPDPPFLSVLETRPLIRSGDEATLRWVVAADYPVQCILEGNAANVTFNYPDMDGSSEVEETYTTAPITNATNFTLTCSPHPVMSGVSGTSTKARINVTPNYQEL